MSDLKQPMAGEFDQYRSLLTDEERQLFWSDVEKRANELSPGQRLGTQADAHENIQHILRRMEAITEQLTITQNA